MTARPFGSFFAIRESTASSHAILLAAGAIAIGVIDYASGPDIGFSLFYLVPIVLGAWYGARWMALALAGLSAVLWMTADAAWHGVNAITLWNSFTRLGIYVAIAWLTARVRLDERELRALNARLQELLEHEQRLARTDPLTGLANRRMFIDELRRAAARNHRTQTPIAVGYIDFDRFKVFNDRQGHNAGDAILRQVAEVLKGHVRGNDLAARLGGDEFGLLLDQCTEETARITADRLLEQLVAVFARASNGEIGLSLGVACFDGPSLNPETMIDHADAAMYCAKAQGTNRVYVTRIAAGRSADRGTQVKEA